MTENNVLATLASKRVNIPVIICERNNPFLQSSSISNFWKILRRAVYPMADILTVQTQRVKSFYSPFIKSEKLVTIPNPVNPNFQNPITRDKENIILNVGSLENQKGQDVLIQAFANAKLKDWRLHILGEGSLRTVLKELIVKLGLEENVSLLGKDSNIGEHYASCKIFAFSSRYEGFPNALLEAMFFSLPCVSTDCPTGPAEIMTDGVNGYLVPVNDHHAITNKFRLLAKDADLRYRLGQKAKIAVEPFQIEEIIDKWTILIQKLLGENRAI